MAEGTVWGSRAVLKIANCVYSVHKAGRGQDSMERTATDQRVFEAKNLQTSI